jgi:hypothetical protein
MSVPFVYILETRAAKEMDESIQTAQDYSLEVLDPDPDASNPDEWMQFFSRFGQIRYITIVKKNSHFIDLLVQKQKLQSSYLNNINNTSAIATARDNDRLATLDRAINTASTSGIPVCRVYVSYEYESSQRLALAALEVANIYALSDSISDGKVRNTFRGKNVLNVREAPEPDTIDWENIQISETAKQIRRVIIYILVLGILVVSFLCISLLTSSSPTVFSIVVTLIDSILPPLFEYLTNWECRDTEGERLRSLHKKLFTSRLLVTTIFAYSASSWKSFLDPDKVKGILLTQTLTCLLPPVLNAISIKGFLKRKVIAPLISKSQDELNRYWDGDSWALSERYVASSKILFVCFFYSIISPGSLLLASVAFFLVFFSDRYLLLRKWKSVALLDTEVGAELKKEILFALAAHMYVSARFIYSWPMDSAILISTSSINYKEYMYIDRSPALFPWKLTPQKWMNDAQQSLLVPYIILTMIVISLAVYTLILHDLIHGIYILFFKIGMNESKPILVPYSAVLGIKPYVPMKWIDGKWNIIADVMEMCIIHREQLLYGSNRVLPILEAISPVAQNKCLSAVKW